MNIEIKGSLARLLATENLLVEHKQVKTASFDVEKRVLTLPVWDKASNTVYNLLVGHEVGHALYTPNDKLDDLPCPKSFVNVTEDARIEKLMKRKYAGLAKDFYQGYKELNDEDFFSIKDENLTKMPLIDRVNLHFKIGAYSMMPFDASEVPLRDAVGAAETFEEAIDAANAIFEFMKAEREKKKQDAPTSQQDGQQGESEDKEWFTDDDPMDRPAKKSDDADLDTPSYETEDVDDWDEPVDQEGYEEPSIDTVKSQESFDSASQSLIDKYADVITYVDFPKINFNKIIVDADTVWADAVNDWSTKYTEESHPNAFEETDRDFQEFCNKTTKEVNYLIKEFECRKSATAHARSTTARTGVLDLSKLHTYKFNDDIFQKVTRTPEGKNHGMIFLLDWSGSMCDDIFDTVKQVINLAQFCKKVGIPFDVYSFVVDGGMSILNGDAPGEWGDVSSNKPGEFYFDPRFKLVNLLTSRVNQKTFTEHCKYLYRTARYYGRRHVYAFTPQPPRFMGLGGTPLNEALVVMESYLGKWQRQNNVEKCHLMVLTDGEAQQSAICRESKLEEYTVLPSYYIDTMVIRRKGRYQKACHNGMSELTKRLVNVLREAYPESSILSFRLTGGVRGLNNFLYTLGVMDHEKYDKAYRKDKSIIVTDSPYTELYVIHSNSLNNETEMQVAEDATKAQIKSAFVKSLKSKGLNRKMLSAFVGQIA